MASVTIDFSSTDSFEDLQRVLKDKLQFPDFYGNNWDAFWDSITGIVEMPDKLEITGWQNLISILPKDAEIFLECLNDYNRQSDLKKIEVLIK